MNTEPFVSSVIAKGNKKELEMLKGAKISKKQSFYFHKCVLSYLLCRLLSILIVYLPQGSICLVEALKENANPPKHSFNEN